MKGPPRAGYVRATTQRQSIAPGEIAYRLQRNARPCMRAGFLYPHERPATSRICARDDPTAVDRPGREFLLPSNPTHRHVFRPGRDLAVSPAIGEHHRHDRQDYVFGLVLQPPTGPGFVLFAQPVTVPPQFELSAPLALPLPVSVPVGDWHLVAVAFTVTGDLIDASRIDFEVP